MNHELIAEYKLDSEGMFMYVYTFILYGKLLMTLISIDINWLA